MTLVSAEHECQRVSEAQPRDDGDQGRNDITDRENSARCHAPEERRSALPEFGQRIFHDPSHHEGHSQNTDDYEKLARDREVVAGADKQKVGQVSARIRAYFPPEPYKGKGVRYLNEQVRRKVGKAGATA